MKRAVHVGLAVFLLAGMAFALKIDHYAGNPDCAMWMK